MNLKQKRLADAMKTCAAEEILSYEQMHEHSFGIISVASVTITDDYQYADIYVHSQFEEEKLPHFIAGVARMIQKKIGKNFSLRKIPSIRFRKASEVSAENDILSLIHTLDLQYGLSHENSQLDKTI